MAEISGKTISIFTLDGDNSAVNNIKPFVLGLSVNDGARETPTTNINDGMETVIVGMKTWDATINTATYDVDLQALIGDISLPALSGGKRDINLVIGHPLGRRTQYQGQVVVLTNNSSTSDGNAFPTTITLKASGTGITKTIVEPI